MSSFELIIGNKNYSSWSLRPWIGLKVMDIPFRETIVPLDFANNNAHLLEYSPSKKVPVLKHEDLIVWDSLAILEYAAEQFPDKGFWPEKSDQRARARSISCQMHSGFPDLRNECPMNMRRVPGSIPLGEGTKNDITQIEALWCSALEKSGGPFLFGEFTIADAMFAPVVNRFLIYNLSQDDTALSYCASMTALVAWKEWAASASREKWVIDYAEV